jgi:hypothetical protein
MPQPNPNLQEPTLNLRTDIEASDGSSANINRMTSIRDKSPLVVEFHMRSGSSDVASDVLEVGDELGAAGDDLAIDVDGGAGEQSADELRLGIDGDGDVGVGAGEVVGGLHGDGLVGGGQGQSGGRGHAGEEREGEDDEGLHCDGWLRRGWKMDVVGDWLDWLDRLEGYNIWFERLDCWLLMEYIFGTSKGRFIYSISLPFSIVPSINHKKGKSYSECSVITKELFQVLHQVPELSSTNNINNAKNNVTM